MVFDDLYENNVLNAVFLVKFSSSGTQEWFRSAGGTEESIAYGITSDGENVFLTGDYGESISILGNGFPVTLSSGFSESIFLFSFSQDGSLNWTNSAGSESLISSRAIDYENGRLGIAGFYRCTLNGYSEIYGEATFNSIGFEDAYGARYDADDGAFLWARNFGSRSDERAMAIALLPDGYDVIGGIYSNRLILPAAGFIAGTSQVFNTNPNPPYCDDDAYGLFMELDSDDFDNDNDQDGFLIKVLREDRAPYDYYLREAGSVCDPTLLNPCLHDGSQNVFNCADTVNVCEGESVTLSTLTYSNEISPYWYHSWDTPSGANSGSVTQPGEYIVQVWSDDGCYMSFDSVYADFNPAVEPPLISDDVVVNDSALSTQAINLCQGEMASIFAIFPDSLSGVWTGLFGGVIGNAADTLQVTQSGYYVAEVTNEFGCSNSNGVLVSLSPIVQDLPIDILFPYNSDTVSTCSNSGFGQGVSVNAVIEGTQSAYPEGGNILDWNLSMGGGISAGNEYWFTPAQTGWHVVSLTVEPILNDCNTEYFQYTAVDSIYVEIIDPPSVSIEVSDPPDLICPGVPFVLDLSYTGDLSYFGNFAWVTEDSVAIDTPGSYTLSVDSTGAHGCQGSASFYFNVPGISTPQIYTDPSNAVICPNDSVQILSGSTGEFVWQGPDGAIPGQNNLWVSESGLYYAEVTLYDGCALVSNTVQLTEYATPFLYSEDGTICEGGNTEIWVISNSMETIEWLPPLSGSDSSQVVTEPGIYSVEVTGCDITTDISIEIIAQEPEVDISFFSDSLVCEGDSLLLEASPGFEEYVWSPANTGQYAWFQDPGSVYVTAFTDDGCDAVSDPLDLVFEPNPPEPEFVFEPVCEGDSIGVAISSLYEINVLDGPDGEVVSNEAMQFVSELNSDTTLYAYVSSELCQSDTASVLLTPIPYPENPILATDAPVCTGEDLTLQVENPETDVSYLWLTPTGEVLSGEEVEYPITDISQAGEYLGFAARADCHSDTVGIDVSLFETVEVELPPDTTLCYDENFFIAADTLFATYQWSDNSNDSILYPDPDIDEPIFLLATDFNGCESIDFITVTFLNCILEVPNIVTPNGDGLNDLWEVVVDEPRSFRVTVFNRSGRIVFQSDDHRRSWDASDQGTGNPCPSGVYFYVIEVDYLDGERIEEQGELTLVRD
jgi:gliding motility-associated-like protein